MFQSVFKISIGFNGFQMMCLKVFSKFPIGFSMVCQSLFSKSDAFQSVFKKCPHRFQWFSLVFNGFQNSKCIGFHIVFQSVFKIPPTVFKVFSNDVHFKVFSEIPIGFNGFQMMCFKVFSKFPISFNGFQMMLFESVFKMCFKMFSKIS